MCAFQNQTEGMELEDQKHKLWCADSAVERTEDKKLNLAFQHQHRLSYMLVEKITQHIVALCHGISPPLESGNLQGQANPADLSFFWGGGGGEESGAVGGNDIQTFFPQELASWGKKVEFLLGPLHTVNLYCMRRRAYYRNRTTQIVLCT